MIIDTLVNLFSFILNGLVFIGAAVNALLVLIPVILLVLLWLMIGNYRDEIVSRRLASSRIAEIDALSAQKYLLLMKALLAWMGFSEEPQFPEDEEEDEQSDYVGEKKKRKAKETSIDEPLIMVKDGVRYGVLIGKKKHGVGRLAFNKLEKAMGERDCREGLIINNGSFSELDLEEGKARNITMHDREWLIKTLLEMQGYEDCSGKDFKYYFYDFWRWALRG